MSENAPELHELLSRVGRLEKENRRFKRGALVLLAAAVTIGLMAQTKPQPRKQPKTQDRRHAPRQSLPNRRLPVPW